ncbi:type VI secretion system Vgr family protein [Apibacter adventoris]|uniref:Rhs element Vgr protein n=3 Tax=Apibacter adventoris TaxID=1679466 RepID=A0A2S8AG42_9FLAO|nr:contractile injection system protein, VgrG/Pvc8 family [Apibacter adventoris]PQL95232.1 Rhs element Vgr protein [Apibacter adventoris]
MSIIEDPNKKAPQVDLSKLTEKLQQSALDSAETKLDQATQGIREEVKKVQETATRVQNKLTRVNEELSPIKGNTFEIIPPEVLEKQKALSSLVTYGGDLKSLYGDSHLVWSTVQIGGEYVLTDSHFTLSIHQQVGTHDSFEILCPSEAFGEKDSYPLTNTRKYLGKRCTLQLKQYGQTTYIFTGIITQIRNKRIDGYSHIILEGKSPTILLENGLDCQSFEKKGLKEIIEESTREYPSDLIQWDIRPHLQEKLLYTVQYRESDYQFIRRLATRYGEWFYYNGTQLVFGGYGGKTVELVEEQDLFEYELKMQLVPQKFTYTSYDAKQAENYTVESESVSVQGTKNPFQQYAEEASAKTYNKVPLSLYNQSLMESGRMELTSAVKRQKQSRQNVFYLEAKTHNPNIRLGDIVKLKAWMPGHEIFKNGEVPLESYRIIEITHNYEGMEGYHNFIVGVPKEIETPPYMEEDAIPQCEEQSATVMDNNDPEGMSRIRVQFLWQKPFNGMTPWIRSITPYAGAGKGMHVVPEIGEEVIVSFENGNAEKPVSLGAMFNGKGKSGHGGKGNYMKGLQTAAGSNLTFNDQKGDMTLMDKGPASLVMDGAGKTTLDSSDKIIISCGASSIELHKDGKIIINGQEIKIEGENKIETKTKSHETVGLDIVTTKSNTIIKEEAPKISVKAKGQVEIKSGETIDVESTISNIKGSGSVNLN